MRESIEETYITTEQVLEYCKAIYNAETEEEIEYVKQDIAKLLKQNGLSESRIQEWIQQLEVTADKLENEEIVFDENGKLVNNERPTQESIQINDPQPMNISSQANTPVGVAFGAVGAGIIIGLALKKKVFKNKKNRNL